jgi:hypothetical protein
VAARLATNLSLGGFMLLLTSTTDSFQVTTGPGTCDLKVLSCFTDRDSTTGVVGAASRAVANIVTATTTTVVAAPAATTTRILDLLVIRNHSASLVTDVTFLYNANTVLYEVVEFRLFPGEVLTYTEELGWKKTTANVYYAEDVMSHTFVANNMFDNEVQPFLMVKLPAFTATKQYIFKAMIHANSTVTTTGVRITIGTTGNASAEHSALRQAGIGVVLKSATAAVLSESISTGSGTSIVQGTGSSVDTALHIISAVWTQPANMELTVGLKLGTEISASRVDVHSAWLRVWEATG